MKIIKISSLGMSPAGMSYYILSIIYVGASHFLPLSDRVAAVPDNDKNRGASRAHTNFLTFDYEYKPAVLVLSALSTVF